PDFVAVRHSTVWVEQRLSLPEADVGTGEPYLPPPGHTDRSQEVRVGGRWYAIPLPGVATRPPSRRSGRPSDGPGGQSGTVASPMQGTVVRVLVVVGEAVEAGQGVCAVEAMKMETVLQSGIAGTVAEVRAGPGQAVRAGEPLVVIAP
ncbi:MAG TPA: biotin/lipoyl-containing protein, partial [Acidimicrobiia bacterium]|nr:biotin/lipoyl-containing protein [Acidimicrobiia bacterium]